MAANKFQKAFLNNSRSNESKKTENVTTINIGEGLLNEASKAVQPKEMDIIYLTPGQIYPSPDNTISMNEAELEELANSLLEVGMLNPIIVRIADDGKYRIVCGERRYRANILNIEKGLRDKDAFLKCHLFNPELIDLPLSDNEKEDYVRDVENAQQRNKTDGDKLMLMRKFEERYKILRERDPERFKGVKTRPLLATDMNISESQVAQFKKVENKGSESLQRAMVDGSVNITAAVDIASMEKEKQDALIAQVLGSGKRKQITKKDVEAYNYQERNKKEIEIANAIDKDQEQELLDDNMTLVTEKSLKKEMKDIFKYLKDKEGIKIDNDGLLTLLNKIRDIDSLLRKY